MKKLLSVILLTTMFSHNVFASELSATVGEQTLIPSHFDAVCRVVSAEARGEGFVGQMAVAEVIKNRSEFYNIPAVNIISEPNQFAKPYYGEISDETKDAVNAIFHKGQTVFNDDSVMYFHANHTTPWWVDEFEFVGDINNHSFYKITLDN